jgi:hypothetical protein
VLKGTVECGLVLGVQQHFQQRRSEQHAGNPILGQKVAKLARIEDDLVGHNHLKRMRVKMIDYVEGRGSIMDHWLTIGTAWRMGLNISQTKKTLHAEGRVEEN